MTKATAVTSAQNRNGEQKQDIVYFAINIDSTLTKLHYVSAAIFIKETSRGLGEK